MSQEEAASTSRLEEERKGTELQSPEAGITQ